MRHLDLFSGIGGFALAASWVWPEHEVVAFCEQDQFCQKVLSKHWPDVPVNTDIHTLRGDEFGSIDLVSGGFPCQPYSVAGKRRGAEDDRALWPEMLRIIKEAKPTWVLGENVAGIIKMELDKVLSDLESIGYETRAFVIPACAVNAPHRRDRVWVVAYSDATRQRRDKWEGQNEEAILKIDNIEFCTLKEGAKYAKEKYNISHCTMIRRFKSEKFSNFKY